MRAQLRQGFSLLFCTELADVSDLLRVGGPDTVTVHLSINMAGFETISECMMVLMSTHMLMTHGPAIHAELRIVPGNCLKEYYPTTLQNLDSQMATTSYSQCCNVASNNYLFIVHANRESKICPP